MFNEETVVEKDLLEKLQNKGWEYIKPDNLERESYEEPVLTSSLVRSIERINKDTKPGEEEIKSVINELKLAGTGLEGIKKIMDFLKFGVPVKFEKERVVHYVQLFDYNNVKKNRFVVSNQVVFQSVDKKIRADIVLFVNGIPLVIIECKNPVLFSSSWHDGYTQIKRYENDVSELFKYCQIGIAVESDAKYFPIVPWKEKVSVYEWRENNKSSVDSIIDMLEPGNILDIVKNFIFYREKFGEASKVVARYMQFRAANKIVDRVLKNLSGEEKKKNGLIWHWQGSGKTLTMIFAGLKLYYSKEMQNPSIYFIVDRTDLEEQMEGEFNALNINVKVISSIYQLKETILHDNYRGERGLMITLIHKFRPEEMEQLNNELKKLGSTSETIRARENIVSFIDEGHRSQYGTLSAQMRSILGDSFFFAFTGTPISKKERDTYRLFSYPEDNEKYYDRYFITDSIRDGFTVKIAYKPRLKSEVHLDRKELDNFIESEFEEIPEYLREDIETEVGKKLSASKVILENPKTIEKIAFDIKNHFSENVEGKFKTMVVAESRKACVYFKRKLDKHFPEEYSEIVMTLGMDEKDKVLREYYEEKTKKHGELDIKNINKQVIEDFKNEKYPQILIVTDMLLTGFDAPVLQTMYLYKLLKEHRLLQAIARTNRPYKDIKEAGVIIDYVGILDRFKRAFEIYSKEEMKGALYEEDSIKDEFVQKLDRLLRLFNDLPKDEYSREVLQKAVEILTSEERKGKEFLDEYKKLRKIFELLGPDEIKVKYFNEYKWISAIYTYYYKQILRDDDIRKDILLEKYFKKTLEYVYESSEIKDAEKKLPEISFDEDYIKNLNEKLETKEEKSANIVFTLNKLILVDKGRDPIYIAISDRVEKILKMWREREKDYERILSEGKNIVNQINKLRSRKKKLNFSDLEYSILLTMEKFVGKKKALVEDVQKISDKIKEDMYEGFTMQPTIMKKIEREVRSFLRKKMSQYDISYDKMNKLHDKVCEKIEEYGNNKE